MGILQSGLTQLEEDLRTTFEVAGNEERVWLFKALVAIARQVDWLAPYLGDTETAAHLDAIRQRAAAGLPAEQQDTEPSPMGGSYGLADAFIGTGKDDQPRGIQVFRGLLWVAIHWCRANRRPYESRARQVAAALRSVAYRPGDQAALVLDRHLLLLGKAEDLSAAIAALDGLTADEHQTLHEAWVRWLKPTLLAVSNALKPAPPKLPPTPPPAPSGPDEPRKPIQFFPLRPRKPLPDQPPFEPPDEFTPPVDLVLVPGYGDGALARDQAEYRARQAVWGRNHFLLTSHTEALFPDIFGAAVRSLVTRLENPVLVDPLACTACLLKAITGRVTKAFETLQMAPAPPTKVNDVSWYLDLDAGTLTFPPYWKQPLPVLPVAPDKTSDEPKEEIPSFFEPETEQRPFLYPVLDFVTLPIPAPIRRALAMHRAPLTELHSIPPTELDRRMAAIATAVAEEVGIPLSTAKLRASLGPLVMEACGDLAMAQIICGDSFGRTSAPQHYYAPRRKDIAAAYAKALDVCFGGSATVRVELGGARIGSELFVNAASAKRLAKASYEWRRDLPAGDAGARSPVRDHQRILDHLVRMVFATTGHRWASSLFHLRLTDLDLESGAVLFADKVHDVAHDPRLAVMPTILRKQLRAYLRHVAGLIEVLPSLCEYLKEVLRGASPLLFELCEVAGRCGIRQPTLEAIAERGPPEWNVLPGYWGRAYIRTRAIEMGADPFLVACQLGHYDAVGYPYSNQSPTEPIEVLQRFHPWLDRVAATQGWTVIEVEAMSGAPKAEQSDSIWPRTPVKDWRTELKSADESARKAHRKWQVALRRDAQKVRQQATAVVLNHPALVQAGISAAYETEGELPEQPSLESLDLYRVRTELLVDCGDDAAMALARFRALRHVLRVVAERAGQPAPAVSIPIAVRRPLDNAFFHGACLGLTHVQLLRANVRGRASIKRPRRDWITQVARTVEALLLFGGIDDVDTLRALLAARGSARSSARIPDLALIPLAGDRVVALRGLAALALQNLAKHFPDNAIPTNAKIEAELATLVPAWAVGDTPSDMLIRLCSTISVANRFEYSPAARFGLDPTHGSVGASIDEQLAFVDGDPTGPARPVIEEKAGAPADKLEFSSGTGSETAHSQYNKLVKAIPNMGAAYESPFTHRKVLASAIGSDTTRNRVVAELDAWLAASDQGQGEVLWSIIRMLGEWTRRELTRRKPDGELLQYKSVKTYLTRIGRALTRELGGLDAARWTERLVEDAYGYALDAARQADFKAAAALLSFHRCVEARFDLPEVDLSAVYAELDPGERRIDAALILPVERAAAFAAIKTLAWSANPAGQRAATIARQADAVAALLGYAGCRLSEPLGMQVRDVGMRPEGMLFARIRSNRLRSLKTAAATRVAVFGPTYDAAQLGRLWEWVQAVGKTAGANRPGGVYIASTADSRNDLSEQHAVSRLIREALARVTGRASEHLHRLRHVVATERIIFLATSLDDARWLQLAVYPMRDRVLQPRDLHGISVPIGHAHWSTTLEWYLHIPWMLQSRAAARLRDEYLDRQTVAAVLGYSLGQIDALTRGSTADDIDVWFDHVRTRRAVPTATPTAEGDADAPTPRWRWTAEAVARLVTDAARAHDLMAPLMRQGIPIGEASRIETCAARWELKLGLRLLPAFIGDRKRRCPSRAIRRMEADSEFNALLELLDKGTASEQHNLRRVVRDFFAYLTPRNGDRVTLPASGARMLRDLLVVIGILPDQILINALAGDLAELKLASRNVQGHTLRGRGRGLKCVLVIMGIAIELQSSPSSRLNASMA